MEPKVGEGVEEGGWEDGEAALVTAEPGWTGKAGMPGGGGGVPRAVLLLRRAGGSDSRSRPGAQLLCQEPRLQQSMRGLGQWATSLCPPHTLRRTVPHLMLVLSSLFPGHSFCHLGNLCFGEKLIHMV